MQCTETKETKQEMEYKYNIDPNDIKRTSLSGDTIHSSTTLLSSGASQPPNLKPIIFQKDENKNETGEMIQAGVISTLNSSQSDGIKTSDQSDEVKRSTLNSNQGADEMKIPNKNNDMKTIDANKEVKINPTSKRQDDKKYKSVEEKKHKGWNCSKCTYFVDSKDNIAHEVCPMCKTPHTQTWTCGNCTFINSGIKRNCEICGKINGETDLLKAPRNLDGSWNCPICNRRNHNYSTSCSTRGCLTSDSIIIDPLSTFTSTYVRPIPSAPHHDERDGYNINNYSSSFTSTNRSPASANTNRPPTSANNNKYLMPATTDRSTMPSATISTMSYTNTKPPVLILNGHKCILTNKFTSLSYSWYKFFYSPVLDWNMISSSKSTSMEYVGDIKSCIVDYGDGKVKNLGTKVRRASFGDCIIGDVDGDDKVVCRETGNGFLLPTMFICYTS